LNVELVVSHASKRPELAPRERSKINSDRHINKLSAVTVGRWLLLLGFACLVIVLFTHVAETLHLFPGMG
jgi:hypothetical protein